MTLLMKVNDAYICTECIFVFNVFSKRIDGRGVRHGFYCPSCGEHFAVIPYVKESSTYKRIAWTPEETKELKNYMGRDIPPHQIAVLLGRSLSSVKNRVRYLRGIKNGVQNA